MTAGIINLLPNIKEKSYLELGIYYGHNYRNVNAKHKVCVDIVSNWEKFGAIENFFLGTTDMFFENLIKKPQHFDVVFIDAYHSYNNVLCDYNNSVKYLNKDGLIFVHDLFPPNKEHCLPHYCGDAYKLLSYIYKNNLIEDTYTLNPIYGDYGLTVFFKPKILNPPEETKSITYEEHCVIVKGKNLLDKESFFKKIQEHK